MKKFPLETTIWVIAAILLVVGIHAEYKESQKWEAYKKEHNCQVIEITDSKQTSGIIAGEFTSFRESGSEVYHCDDGVRYIKNRR